VNVPVSAPPEIEHVEDATTVPDIEHEVSLVEKPEPDTAIVDPIKPAFRLRNREGEMKVVVALEV
jgi:hypothetical protein